VYTNHPFCPNDLGVLKTAGNREGMVIKRMGAIMGVSLAIITSNLLWRLRRGNIHRGRGEPT